MRNQDYKKKGPFNRNCKTCGRPFVSSVPQAKYCGKNCWPKSWGSTYPGLSTGSIGAIAELRVCSDLLAQGFEVFRAVSPSCSCDLIILKNGVMRRIEVRTARTYGVPEKLSYPTSPQDEGRQDHFCGGAAGSNSLYS